MPFCRSCGVELESGNVFCANCGAKVEASPTAQPRGYGVILDKTHYETLGYRSGDLIKTLREELRDQVQILEGSWKQHIFENPALYQSMKGIVLGGVEKWDTVSDAEKKNIKNFVKEGGSLFLTCASHMTMDDSTVELNKFSRVFGIRFSKETATDEEHHHGRHSDHVLIHNFVQHPITEGLNMICFSRYGGRPIIVKNPDAQVLAFTDEDAKPPEEPVLAVVPYGKGRVIAFSCSTCFADFELDKYDNMKLAKNVFRYMSQPVSASEIQQTVEQLSTQQPSQALTTEEVPTAGEYMRQFDVLGYIERVKREDKKWKPKKHLEQIRERLMFLQLSYTYFVEIGEERLQTIQQKAVFRSSKKFVKVRDRKPILFDDEQLVSLGDYLLVFKGGDKYIGKFFFTGRRFIFATEEAEMTITYELFEKPPEFGRPMFSIWIKPELEGLFKILDIDGWEEGTVSKKKYNSIRLAIGKVKDGVMELNWIKQGLKDTKIDPVVGFFPDKRSELSKVIVEDDGLRIEDASQEIQSLIDQSTSTDVLDIEKYYHACRGIPGAMVHFRTGPPTPAARALESRRI